MQKSLEVRFHPEDLKLLIPQDKIVSRVSYLLSLPQANLNEIAFVCLQDPVINLNILLRGSKFVNQVKITTDLAVLILRLGVSDLKSLLSEISNPTVEENPMINFYYQKRVLKLTRTAVVARILAEVCAKHLASEVSSLALLCRIVELPLMIKHPKEYTELVEKTVSSNFYLKFPQIFSKAIDALNIIFLQTIGMNSNLIKILNPNEPAVEDQLILRCLIFGAEELVFAFETNRLNRYSPGSQLPSNSLLRLLPISEQSYGRAFERITLFLHKKASFEGESIDSEINQTNIHSSISLDEGTKDVHPDLDKLQNDLDELLKDTESNFENWNKNIDAESNKTAGIGKSIPSLKNVIDELKSVESFEDLCEVLLLKLVSNNLFDRSALLELSVKEKRLYVKKSVGGEFKSKIYELDELVLNTLNFTKVKSSAIPAIVDLPLGSPTFAFMPLPAGSKLYILYADTYNRPIGLDLRTSFREVANLALKKLQELNIN